MKVVLDRNNKGQVSGFIYMSVMVVFILALSLSIHSTPASARAISAAPLCGNGSAPDYGFTYDLQQAHWTVGWQGYTSEQTVNEVDVVLDRLNADSIAQTMILILPQDQVGNRVNCAVHFLRYMKLGLPYGDRKDNGFAFLIVVESSRIDVHYGVGLGLPALTASELTNLNRTAEATFQTTKSLDKALLTLIQDYDNVTRDNYTPLVVPTPTFETINLPPLPSGNLGILTICGMICLGFILVIIMIWLLSVMARYGITFNSPGSRSGGMGNPFGGGGGGGRGSPPSRGGSGSGRSGRGN